MAKDKAKKKEEKLSERIKRAYRRGYLNGFDDSEKMGKQGSKFWGSKVTPKAMVIEIKLPKFKTK